MDINEVVSELETTTDKLLATLAQFDDADFNRHPQPDAWSAADLCEHIGKSYQALNRLLAEPGQPAGRAKDEKFPVIKTGLLNRNRKWDVADFLKPAPGEKDREDCLHKLKNSLASLIEIFLAQDNTEIVSFPHPQLGPLTRLEWVYLNIYHTQRHTAQLEEVHAAIGSTAGESQS